MRCGEFLGGDFINPDTHIADTQRPLPYCLTATEMKKSPQLSELL